MADLGGKDSESINFDVGLKPDQPHELDEMHAQPAAQARLRTALSPEKSSSADEWKLLKDFYLQKCVECEDLLEATSSCAACSNTALLERFASLRHCVEDVRNALPLPPSGAVPSMASLPASVKFLQSASTTAKEKLLSSLRS